MKAVDAHRSAVVQGLLSQIQSHASVLQGQTAVARRDFWNSNKIPNMGVTGVVPLGGVGPVAVEARDSFGRASVISRYLEGNNNNVPLLGSNNWVDLHGEKVGAVLHGIGLTAGALSLVALSAGIFRCTWWFATEAVLRLDAVSKRAHKLHETAGELIEELGWLDKQIKISTTRAGEQEEKTVRTSSESNIGAVPFDDNLRRLTGKSTIDEWLQDEREKLLKRREATIKEGESNILSHTEELDRAYSACMKLLDKKKTLRLFRVVYPSELEAYCRFTDKAAKTLGNIGFAVANLSWAPDSPHSSLPTSKTLI